jgi:hypothetical protein
MKTQLVIIFILLLLSVAVFSKAEARKIYQSPRIETEYGLFTSKIQGGDQTSDRQDEKIREAMAILVKSLTEKNFAVLEPYLAENYRVGEFKGQIALSVIKQFIASGARIPSGYRINTIKPEAENFRVSATFVYQSGEKEQNFLLTGEGKFIEINLFSAMTKSFDQVPEAKIKTPSLMELPFVLKNRLIFVNAEANGQKGLFVVDSGAPRLVLNQVYFKPDEKVNTVSNVQGVGGTIGNINVEKVTKFKWNEFEMADFEAISMNLAHLEKSTEAKILGLIGFEQLSRFEAIFDYKAKKLILINTDSDGNKMAEAKMSAPKVQIPFELLGHIPVLAGKIGDQTLRLGLDTGANTNLLDSALFEPLKTHFRLKKSEILRGADSNSKSAQKGEVDDILIGNRSYKKMNTVFSDISHLNKPAQPSLSGLLGYEFLSRQVTGINFKKKKLYIW